MQNKWMKILQWSVVLLAICNIVLLLTIWLKPSQADQSRPETPRDFVIRSLSFTDEQTAKYDVMVREHQQSMRELRDKANEYRTALFAHLKNEQQFPRTIDSLTELVTGVQKQIETVTYNHFAQVRAICTDAQKPGFDNIIGDVIRKMNGRPHHPPHDGQGPPPPPNGAPPPPPDGR